MAPNNPASVRVKVSTSTQNVYVPEGDRLLMAVQGCVGANGATPLGNHQILSKGRDNRSSAFGFDSQGNPADSRLGENVVVGYPMDFWCEFAPGYGFHEGFVWSEPRTHGCIRLHKEAAARLFQIVRSGTPVNIAASQPEDRQYGHLIARLDQRHDPDPPTSLLMSNSWFADTQGPLLVKE